MWKRRKRRKREGAKRKGKNEDGMWKMGKGWVTGEE